MRNAIGIDIGGTNIRAARVSADGTIIAHQSGPTPRNAEEILSGLARMVAMLRDGATAAIGIGAPGRVDGRTGQILSGGFVDLSVLPLAALLRQATGLPSLADNDANMALAAEAQLGAAKGHDHAVMLTIGTGIGGAILADGQIFHGGATAGQLGHITVNMAGLPCSCGRTGCLETESSGTALHRHMAAYGIPAGTRIGDLLVSAQPAAQAAVMAWAVPLRAGIDSLVAAFGPEVVILGGGLGASAASALERVAAPSPWFQCPVTAARLGDEAGVIGAALAALQRLP